MLDALLTVCVQLAFRAPVLSVLQAGALLAVVRRSANPDGHGGCRAGAAAGLPTWLVMSGAFTAVVSIALAVALFLIIVVQERRTGRSPERRSGQVWTRFSPMTRRAENRGLIDPLLVVPGMTCAIVASFAALYLVLFSADTSTFHTPDCAFDALDAVYFSVVTAATVGFGDVSPVTHLAQIAVVAEMVLTAFGLALFVATVVGRTPIQPETRFDRDVRFSACPLNAGRPDDD